MAKIDELFKVMVEKGASDLHVSTGSAPILRLHGEMVKLPMKILNNEEVQALLFELLSDKQKRQFIENWELDTSYTIEGLARFRVNIFMQRKGMAAVFRLIPTKIRSMEDLKLPPEVSEVIKAHKGLICVTGPTGSGKSTTLASLIDYFNRTTASHILTIEDPIEFVHQNQMSLINQREVSSHTKSFANALRAALREDPDIILLGEMRDLETIQLALTAAETGHLVFGTLHTSSAHKTVDRIIDVFPDAQQAQIRVQLAESLRGVIAQTLLPRADGAGRVAALEIMINTKAIANLIREGKTFQIPSAMQTTRGAGNLTLKTTIDDLIAKQLITREKGHEVLGIGEEARPEASRGAAPEAAAQPQVPPTPSLSSLANRFKKPG